MLMSNENQIDVNLNGNLISFLCGMICFIVISKCNINKKLNVIVVQVSSSKISTTLFERRRKKKFTFFHCNWKTTTIKCMFVIYILLSKLCGFRHDEKVNKIVHELRYKVQKEINKLMSIVFHVDTNKYK